MAESEQYDEKPEGQTKSDKADIVAYWLDALEMASKAEKDWRKDGDAAVKVYRGDKAADDVFARSREFNIFHSNVETTLPAIYNSTPSPDVRRRFGDKDKVAKTVSQVVERCLSYSVDTYDFDEIMRLVLFDAEVAGRGVARVRYVPYFTEIAPDKGDAAEGETYPEHPEKAEGVENNAEPEPNEQLTYEETRCEYVPWKRFRVGPADDWNGVPWIAFEHLLTRDEIEKLNEDAAEKVNLDCRLDGQSVSEDDKKKSDNLKRSRVWEIWDKEERKVIFIATGYPDEPLKEEDDPLGLDEFFPIPRPVQKVMTPGDLTPVCPYTIYRELVEELNEITFRIKRLVKQIRVRGGFGAGGADLDRLMMADDGELIPLEGVEAWLDGGIEKAVMWWPIEPAVKALQQLYTQREQVKQTIYEVTGISDIVRGASKASETATAQQIKNQWGSLRIQKMQQEVQRYARDLFRLKADIIAKKFSPQTIMMISGVMLLPKQQKAELQQAVQPKPQAPGMPPAAPPPQLPEEIMRALQEPSAEEVFGVLQSDLLRSYKIDIESDSTIRADLTRNQEAMSNFLAGTAQFMAAFGPAVQSGQIPAQAPIEIYSAFARNFKLGKQAEDALEKLSEAAGKPQPPKVDPEAEKAKAQMAMEQQKAQVQQQNDAAKLQLEQRKAEMQAANDQAKMQADMAQAEQKMRFDMELAREKAAQDYQLKVMQLNAELEIKREMASQQAAIDAQQSDNKMAIAAREAKHKSRISQSAAQ